MPNYEVTVDGKLCKIEITKKSEKSFEAKIDDKPRTVELATEAFSADQVLTVKVDGKAFRVELPKIEREKPVTVKVEEATFKVEVKTPGRKQAVASFEPAPVAATRRAGATKQATAEGAVTAPMTGKIISVKVRKGEQVKANQVLCVIEAMKMENEIAASKAGVVQEVSVAQGQPVNEGDTLFVVG
jgi:biotin carboxyl carrier protein